MNVGLCWRLARCRPGTAARGRRPTRRRSPLVSQRESMMNADFASTRRRERPVGFLSGLQTTRNRCGINIGRHARYPAMLGTAEREGVDP